MNKILTISIAAYDMQEYIGRAIESLIDDRIIDCIEVFVIDDGGTDKTLEIAKEYALKYPDSIYPVHKENGGYGSTLNYSVTNASGKYFKLLDSDDWFDKDGLYTLVETLKHLDTDVVLTNYSKGTEILDLQRFNVSGYDENIVININNLKIEHGFPNVVVTYKTDLIRKSKLVLPEHKFYTDNIYCALPFSYAKTLYYINTNVYCYWVGRDGQSINKNSIRRHIDDHLFVCREICSLYESRKNDPNCFNPEYLFYYAYSSYRTSFIWFIKYIPLSKEMKKLFIRQEKSIIECSLKTYIAAAKGGISGLIWNLMRKTNYLFYSPIMVLLKALSSIRNII